VEPASVWQDRAPHHLVLAGPAARAPLEPPPQPVLSRAEFAGAVRQALRDYTRPERLATNPLVRSGVLTTVAGEAPSPATLQALLREAVLSLTANPKDIKFHRAVWHTYVEPAPTQERAAELLGLPFNTYRYQLARGIEHIAERLWWHARRDAEH
jgi:hypothetical protein